MGVSPSNPIKSESGDLCASKNAPCCGQGGDIPYPLFTGCQLFGVVVDGTNSVVSALGVVGWRKFCTNAKHWQLSSACFRPIRKCLHSLFLVLLLPGEVC